MKPVEDIMNKLAMEQHGEDFDIMNKLAMEQYQHTTYSYCQNCGYHQKTSNVVCSKCETYLLSNRRNGDVKIPKS